MTIPKKFPYKNIDGNHFPDADVGDELYYALDFTCWLNSENDAIVGARWEVPEGVIKLDDFVLDDQGNIKISTPNIGIFKILCYLTSAELGFEQINAIPTMLKVY
jgi:hypothetical protein